MAIRRIPNLFVIGAMKAGTSSLHEYLHQHPQIFMSRFKEPQYFAPHRTPNGHWWGQGNPCPEPGIGWYLRLFEGGGDAVWLGESSTAYSKWPQYDDCARRIFEFNPDARIIYLIRDPVERTISHYWYELKCHRESRTIFRALRGINRYLEYSYYARQITPYISRFGRHQVYIVSVERLMSDPIGEFSKLMRWLGLESFVPDISSRHNVTSGNVMRMRRSVAPFRRFLLHHRSEKLTRLMPNALKECIRSRAFVRERRCDLDIRKVADLIRPRQLAETKELESLLGYQLSEWTLLYANVRAV